jgi:hypothetical protein
MYIGRVLDKQPIDIHDFDPMALVRVARQHLETLEEPRRRQILENLIEHAEAEASGDHRALMASCSRESQTYAVYGSTFPAPQSFEDLDRHYAGLIDANLYWIHFEVEKLVVGSDVIFIEGLVHQLYPGELIEPIFGLKVADPSSVQQLTSRTALTFIFDEAGKGAGEHAYTDGPPALEDFTPVPAHLLPKGFTRESPNTQ